MAPTSYPVSYTHLDVYKRQPVDHPHRYRRRIQYKWPILRYNLPENRGGGLREDWSQKSRWPDVHLNWEKVAKRITSLVQKGRYLTEQEQAQYDKIQAEKDLAEEDAIQAQQLSLIHI